MTIPVENRPRYEVGEARSEPEPRSSTPELRSSEARSFEARSFEARSFEARRSVPPPTSSTPPAKVRVLRVGPGCLGAGMLLAVLLTCCVGSVVTSLLDGSIDEARADSTSTIIRDLRAAAEQHGQEEQHRGAIDQLEELSGERRIGWLAFSVLLNRWNDAKEDDRLTPEELEHLMALVRDIDARGGDIDPEDYPRGR